MDTFTLGHCSDGASFISFSMASFIVFIPTAWCTSVLPKYCARNTFFGSSIGVGKDCAGKQIELRVIPNNLELELNYHVAFFVDSLLANLLDELHVLLKNFLHFHQAAQTFRSLSFYRYPCRERIGSENCSFRKFSFPDLP